MKIRKTLAINLIALLGVAAVGYAGQCSPAPCWSKLTNTYTGNGAGPCLVLTDGTVACNNSQSNTNLWYRLTPDIHGSYLNGTWSNMPNMPYQPIFYASAVLPDGKMIIQGGEYLNGTATWTNQGAVYNPTTNAWTSITCNVIASGSLGDSQSVIFPGGDFQIANIVNNNVAVIPFAKQATMDQAGGCISSSNCYSLVTTTGKPSGDRNDEEGWTLLPNGNVLTALAIKAPIAQTYNESTTTWTSTTNTTAPCVLEDSGSQEVGPLVLRPGDANNANMTVIGFSATVATGHTGGCTAIYDTVAGTWSQGPDIPGGNNLDMADAPASLLINGNVLAFASPGVFGSGGAFFEWDGKHLNSVPCVPNCAGDSSFVGHMVVLPTGEVMFTDYSTDVELYTTSGTYNPAWAPVITGIPYLTNHPVLFSNNKNYEIDGQQFNGLAQGAQYGDDLQTATNWPLVRATQAAAPNNVYYFKTHDHSTMAVATGTAAVSTHFDIPATVPNGLYKLQVVANGIPSAARVVCVIAVGTGTASSTCGTE